MKRGETWEQFDAYAGPLLLTIARLVPRKGHDIVIKALPRIINSVPSVKYLIVGSGDQSVLKDIAIAENVQDAVIFVEYVSEEELPLLYKLCSVYVMVSRWDCVQNEVEGFGMVYLEAGASKKACIAGSAGGCPDAVEDNVTGFVIDPESSAALAEAAIELLTHEELREEMGEAGRDRVFRLFTKSITVGRISDILFGQA